MKQRPIKVIQFGEGNFLRAFVDWMIQKMNDEGNYNGGVAVVQPLEKGLINLLKEQDYTYTHYMRGMKNKEAVSEHYKNDVIERGINPYENFQSFLDLAHIDTAEVVISNTTEAGIAFDENDRFDNDAKVTYPGKLTRLLFERFQYVNGDMNRGFLILPCELIDKNADYLRTYVLRYTTLWDLGKDFREWVEKANTFCNTLVDRIVPGYPRDRIEEIWKELGYKDQLVVESEQFNLWVIQGNRKVKDKFPADVNGCHALFVDDVTPYKMRKVRILNGAHTTLVPVAYLYGARTVREAVEDPTLNKFLMKALYEEIIPTLTLPKKELETFAEEVLDRFKNPFVKHYLMSISLNSMSKYETRVLPSVTGYLEKNGKLPEHLVFALASYIVFYRGEYKGETIDVNDSPDILNLYEKLWKGYDGSKESVEAIVKGVLGYESNWKGDLNHIPQMTEQVCGYVWKILEKGIEEAVTGLCEKATM